MAPALAGLGALLAGTGRCADAEPYLRRAMTLVAESAGERQEWEEVARSGLAECTTRG